MVKDGWYMCARVFINWFYILMVMREELDKTILFNLGFLLTVT